MKFINSLINKFSKSTPINEMIISEPIEGKKELKKGSAKLVRVLLYETNKEIEVSEDVALILLNRKKIELCQ